MLYCIYFKVLRGRMIEEFEEFIEKQKGNRMEAGYTWGFIGNVR